MSIHSDNYNDELWCYYDDAMFIYAEAFTALWKSDIIFVERCPPERIYRSPSP